MRKQKQSNKTVVRAQAPQKGKARKTYVAPKLTVHGKLQRLAAGSGACVTQGW